MKQEIKQVLNNCNTSAEVADFTRGIRRHAKQEPQRRRIKQLVPKLRDAWSIVFSMLTMKDALAWCASCPATRSWKSLALDGAYLDKIKFPLSSIQSRRFKQVKVLHSRVAWLNLRILNDKLKVKKKEAEDQEEEEEEEKQAENKRL